MLLKATIEEKICSKCGVKKRISHYKTIIKTGVKYKSNICIACISLKQTARKAAHKEYADALPV